MKMLSKKILNESHGQDSSYFLGWEEYEKNPYHQVQNPNGIIQMGLAENQLSFDLLESWLSDHPEALGLKNSNTNGESLFKELALFQDYHGLPAFKNELVEFMSQIRGHKVKFDANKLVLTAGATSANEILMFCLADPGDAFLIPVPYYPGFDRDLKWRTGVEIVPIQCTSSNGFRITSTALEQAYKQAQEQGLNVKGVLVTNPSNPLGTTLTRHELDTLLDFAETNGVHLVSDEIYSGTVFDSDDFVSVAEALADRDSATNVSERVHIVYSLSKDLGLPGFRVGMIYSNDEDVVSAATKMSSFGLVSAQTQHTLSSVLSDRRFTSKYVRENKRRLRKRKDVLVSGLKSVGVKCLKGNAGLFSWVDMRTLLSSESFEAEKELWKRIVYEVGLNVSPGSSCHCTEPGWFRVCFANMSEETLYVAIQRFRAFAESVRDNKVKQIRTGKLYLRAKSLPKWVFQISSLNNNNDHHRETDR